LSPTHLIALAAETGDHPLVHLYLAAFGRDLSTAGDMAAVLDGRLPEPARTHPGPLAWLPGIPQPINDHPGWGDYLAQRSQLIADVAHQIRQHAGRDGTQPVWAPPDRPPSAALIGKVAVWRAAYGIDPTTADPPDQHNSRPLPPNGNNASSTALPTPATTRPVSMSEGSKLHLGPSKVAGRDDRDHWSQPSEVHRRPLPPGPSR
jgi:hypothetical protein